jgi:hypothetical protein
MKFSKKQFLIVNGVVIPSFWDSKQVEVLASFLRFIMSHNVEGVT